MRRLLLAATALFVVMAPGALAADVDIDQEGSAPCVWMTMNDGRRVGFCIR